MTLADIKMVTAMLTLIRDDAKEKEEDKTAEQIESVIQILNEKAKSSN